MFLTPYQTTACSSYNVKGIQSALERAVIHNDLVPAVTPKGSVYPNVYMVPPYVKDIAPFTMPLEFNTPDGPGVVIDVRGLTKATGETSFKVLAGGEYEGAVLRAILTKGWIEGAAPIMRRFNDISGRVFIRLLSESLVRRLGLNPFDQQGVVIACGLFYFSNFSPAVEASVLAEDEKERMAVAIGRMTRINPQTILGLLAGEVPVPASLDLFCDALRSIVKSPRLEKVDAALIMTMMGGFWYGGNARQLMAVALEYPPAWLSLMYQAISDRSFHGAQLTKMVDAENRNKAGDSFVRDVTAYLESLSDE